MFFLNQLKEGVDNIRDSFNDAIEPGIRFETAVAEMSGITNMEGKELDVLATKARNTAKAFGTDAADAMVVYKDLLSKITPELKKAPDALEIMSNNVMTLSKTMSNDVPGASAAMSTAMNQYKVSLDDPMKAAQTMTDYMNIMAAGTVEGSAEIREVAEALKQTGSVAKTFGVEFAETNSLIQLLDKSGKKGSEGGIALRNTIVKLQAPTTDAIKQLLQAISDRQEQIRKDLGAQISEMEEKVVGMEIPEELPPRMVQHRFSLSLDATRNFWLFMSMFVVIAVQSVGLYLDWRPDRSRYDNDLKYRYVLMKGEASPKRLSELEELFEVERDQRRIDSMRQDVEKYERLVRRRAALDEQARLKAQEAEQLKRDAAKLKNK